MKSRLIVTDCRASVLFFAEYDRSGGQRKQFGEAAAECMAETYKEALSNTALSKLNEVPTIRLF